MTHYYDPNYQMQQMPYGQPQGYVVRQVPATPSPSSVFSLDVKSSTFWTGAVLGAGLTLLVTNESVQKTVMKTASKLMAATSGGVEELKEKYRDAKAEVDAEEMSE